MFRLLFVVVVLALVAACNTQQLAGRGELVIAQRVVAQVDRWERSDELSDLKVAVEPRSRSIGASYCADGIGVCLNDNGLGAVQRCEKSGKFECALFFYDHHVVWEGPVLYRHEATRQLLPHNGAWTYEISSEKDRTMQGTLFARQFKLSLIGLVPSGRCGVDIVPQSRSGGRFAVSCKDGPAFLGDYVVEGGQKFVGRSSSHTLKVDFSKGRQLIPDEERKCPGCRQVSYNKCINIIDTVYETTESLAPSCGGKIQHRR